MFHTGWISLYDAVGLVGAVTFIILGWSEIRMAAAFVFGPHVDRQSSLFPFYVWILSNMVGMMISFFTVFGDFAQGFTSLCIYAIVLSQLSDIGNTAPSRSPRAQRTIRTRRFKRLSLRLSPRSRGMG